MGPETHSGVPATRIFEFTAPDAHSAAGEGDVHHLVICDDNVCLAAAEAEARYWHATHHDFYPATAADIAAILGAA
jgi:hypothetical protein